LLGHASPLARHAFLSVANITVAFLLLSARAERPCDDVCGLDPHSSEPDGDAADFLDRPTDQ